MLGSGVLSLGARGVLPSTNTILYLANSLYNIYAKRKTTCPQKDEPWYFLTSLVSTTIMPELPWELCPRPTAGWRPQMKPASSAEGPQCRLFSTVKLPLPSQAFPLGASPALPPGLAGAPGLAGSSSCKSQRAADTPHGVDTGPAGTGGNHSRAFTPALGPGVNKGSQKFLHPATSPSQWGRPCARPVGGLTSGPGTQGLT